MEKRGRGRPRKNPPAEKPKEKDTEGRDASGRFTSGYKGGGRPKKPEELKDIHKKTIPELLKIASDKKNPVKVRADVLKWLTEMDIGKPRQQVDAEINDNRLEVELTVV